MKSYVKTVLAIVSLVGIIKLLNKYLKKYLETQVKLISKIEDNWDF